jgi:NarL family two-component system response regulator LiaR
MSGSESSALVRVPATDSLPLMLRAIAEVGDRRKPVLELVAAETDHGAAVRQVEQLLLGWLADGISPMDAIRLLIRCCRARVLLLCDLQDVPAGSAPAVQAAGDPSEPEASAGRIVDAILQSVCQAQHAICAAGASPPKPPLTARELEVINAVVAHPSAKYITIAEMLKVTEHTVHNHLTSIYQKLNLVNRTGLLHYAITHQISGVAAAPAQRLAQRS